MTFEPFDLPRYAVEPSRQGGLEPIGAVGREMRDDRCLYDSGSRYPLSGCVIGEPAGEIGWEPEGMPCTQGRSKPHVVSGIERHLARDCADLTLHRPEPLRIVIGFVLQGLELVRRLARFGRYLFMLR